MCRWRLCVYYVCVAAAATFSGRNTRACVQFRSTRALHCWLVACTALIVPAVGSCPSFTSSVEEGRAVCPGEELTYNCTVFDTVIPTIATWTGFCSDNSSIFIAHGVSTLESDMCGPFSVQATGNSISDCYTSTLTVSVTASPELSGTVIQCSHESVEVGRATLLVAGIHVYCHARHCCITMLQVLPPPSPSPLKTPPLTLSPALP